MVIDAAERIKGVKEYYFSIKRREMAAINEGRTPENKIINLGIGSPDGMPPSSAIEALAASANLPDSHSYQSYTGLPQLREAFASWYRRSYGVELNPNSEIQPLVGSKEGILLIFMTFINRGDKVLVPDPGYPTYSSSAKMVEAQLVCYDLKEENGWQPDFDAIEKTDLSGVKMMWMNYPNMPTGAPATEALYRRAIEFGKKHNILIINDNPYSFIQNDKPLSLLAVPGAKECALELNSLSKSHNMSGWRIGMVAGDAEYISLLLRVKTQTDSGMFKPLQMAAIEALNQDSEWYETLNKEYAKRKKAAAKLFDTIGVGYDMNTQGLFLWGRVGQDNRFLSDPTKTLGEQVSDTLLYKAGVFVAPGFIFGHNGDNYIRASLCAPVEVLEKAIERIRNI